MPTIEELFGQLAQHQRMRGYPGRKKNMLLLRQMLVRKMQEEEIKVRTVGNHVIELHPNMKTKNFPNGAILIYSVESYKRALEYRNKVNL